MDKLIIDTNILIYDFECFDKFTEDIIYIPQAVLKELEKIKSYNNPKGHSARYIIDMLNELSKEQNRNLKQGLFYKNEHKTIEIKFIPTIKENKEEKKVIKEINDILENNKDAKILTEAYLLKCRNEENNVVFMTRDNLLSLVSKSYIETKEYPYDVIEEEIYKGYYEKEVHPSIIEDLYRNKKIKDNYDLYPWEFIIFTNNENTQHQAVGIKRNHEIHLVDFKNIKPIKDMQAKNLEQKMLFYLLNELHQGNILGLSVAGSAGRGKTLLTINYALAELETKNISNILYTKSIQEIDSKEELGFLKGDEFEKFRPSLEPFYNAMEVILEHSGRKEKNIDLHIEQLLEDKSLIFQPLGKIRGMNFRNKITILDEAQNTTQHMIKTFITRHDDTSKMIIIGDIDQIDDKNLNKKNNGFTHFINKGMEEECIAHICFDISPNARRGKLATFGSTL